jgi:NADPH:quinone reductase-like Zn-dependent oxidoreductase
VTYAKELFEQFVLKDGLEVKVHEVYPLKEVARAHDDLEGRKTAGKLLIKI